VLAIAAAVREVPQANASFDRDALVLHPDVNVSVAIDTPWGLVVLALFRTLTLTVIAESPQEIVDLACEDRLELRHSEGAPIDVSNLGTQGTDSGTALVTIPRGAVVFVGAIRDEVIVVDGDIGVRPMIRVSCAFDHPVLERATAVRFTAVVRRELELP